VKSHLLQGVYFKKRLKRNNPTRQGNKSIGDNYFFKLQRSLSKQALNTGDPYKARPCRQSSARTFSKASTSASAFSREKIIGGLSLSTLCRGPSVLMRIP